MLAIAGCRKPVQITPEDEPMPILLSASVTGSLETKSSIEQWNDTEVNVFGLKREKMGYDYKDPSNIVDKTATISSEGVVSLYSDKEAGIPYYYAEGKVYDFYAYHLGGAEVKSAEAGVDSYSMSVRLDGTNDLLYASTDKNKDLEAYSGSDLDVNYLYSATSARRGVHPVLRFSHALTRFKFIVKGMGDSYDMFSVAGLKVKAVDTGTFTLGKDYVGFEPSGELVWLELEKGDDSAISPNPSSTPLGGDDASLMVAPGQRSMTVTLKLTHSQENLSGEYSFEVNSSDISLTHDNGDTYTSETFLPGYSYNIFMLVYGLEQIEIYSSVDEWTWAGDYEVDPDDYDTPSSYPSIPGTDIETDVSVGEYEDGGNLGDKDLED